MEIVEQHRGLLVNALAKLNIQFTETSEISVERNKVFNVLSCPEDKDIRVIGSYDLDGDVSDIFTIDGKRYVLPYATTLVISHATNSLSKSDV